MYHTDMIVLIAFKNLFKEKGRLLITISGVTFSVVLILLLLGLYQGWSTQITKFLGGIEADLWVGSNGSSDLSHGISILPKDTGAQLEDVAGTDKVVPFVGRQISFSLNGGDSHVYLIGQDEDKIIHPYTIVEGKSSPDKGEIIIDQTFARKENLNIDDKLDIQGVELRIAGISKGGNLLAYTYAIATTEDVRDALKANDYTNYFIIKSSDPELTEKEIKDKYPNLQAIPKDNFINNNSVIIKDSFLPIIAVLLLVALVIGTAIIGLTIYTSVVEKSREYGVLKAIGYTNYQLFGIAVIQSFMAGLLGLIVGNILAPIIAQIAYEFVGGFIYENGYSQIIGVAVTVMLMSILASFIPLKRILSIDPAEVFKA